MDHLPSWSGYYPRIDQINGRDGLGASLHLAHRASSLRSYARIGFPADSSNRDQIPGPSPKNKRALKGPFVSGGEGGIRTHEGQLTLAGFQDQCIQPLCHLSMRRRILRVRWRGFNTEWPIMIDLALDFGRDGRKSLS